MNFNGIWKDFTLFTCFVFLISDLEEVVRVFYPKDNMQPLGSQNF